MEGKIQLLEDLYYYFGTFPNRRIQWCNEIEANACTLRRRAIVDRSERVD